MVEKKHQKILITRPKIDALETAEILKKKGYDFLCESLIGVTYEKKQLNLSANEYAGLIFTSRNAVRGFIQNCDNRDFPVFTVGDKTHLGAQKVGFKNVQSASGTVQDLISLLSKHPSNKPYLYVRGAQISQPLKTAIEGVCIEEEIIYHIDIKEKFSENLAQALVNGELSDVLFYSKRTAQGFVNIVQKHADKDQLLSGLKTVKALCLGRPMIEYVSVLPWQEIRCADHPDQDHLIALLDK